VAQKQGFSFAFPPFCQIETKDFIASDAQLSSDAAKFSHLCEATLPLGITNGC
jgi:hypothetical protein